MYKSRHFSTSGHFYSSLAVFLLLGLFLPGLYACLPFNGQIPTSEIIPSASPSPYPVILATSTPTLVPLAPTASPTPTGCRETSGRIEKDLIETKLLDKPMRYNVYLPPCYAAETGRRYPVLYLLHGQNFDEGQWIRIGAASTADHLISGGELPPFIIVMPYDYSFKQPFEYKFEQVFIEMLLPRIDLAYRTLPDAVHRAIGGLSRGGAWAIHLGIRHPDLFGAVGAHSLAVFYSDMDTMRLRLRDADTDHFPRIFIDVGDHDSEYESARPFAELLDEMDIPHEWHEYVGFHEEKYWSAHVEEYLRWYTEAWK